MSFFKVKKLSTETLGEYLSHARTSLGLSLDRVRRLTQIPDKFLVALEAGDYDALPADVYVKGFLKTLAVIYKVPTESLLAQFEKECRVARHLAETPPAGQPSHEFKIPRVILTPRILTVSAAVALTILSLGYLLWQIYSVSAAPKLAVTYPPQDTAVNTRSLLLRGSTEAGSKIFVNAQEILVEENGNFQEVVNLVDGRNSITIKAENKFGKSSTLERVVMASPPPVEPYATSTAVLVADLLTVTVAVGPDDSWINVTADSRVVQDGVVSAGQKLVFTADKELLLTTGDAGSTRVSLNGQDLGLLGKKGEVLSNIKFSK